MKKRRQQETALTPEWSHKIEAAGIVAGTPFHIRLEATERQCRDLARRAGVRAVDALETTMTLSRPPGNNLVYIKGFLKGLVTQDCSVTLEQVQNEVREEFEAWFSDNADVVSLAGVRRERDKMLSGGEVPVAEERDDPEPAVDGMIDAGELAAQYFCLAVDPYPQAPDSNYENHVEAAADAPPPRQNPFAALKDWKASRGGGTS